MESRLKSLKETGPVNEIMNFLNCRLVKQSTDIMIYRVNFVSLFTDLHGTITVQNLNLTATFITMTKQTFMVVNMVQKTNKQR